MAAEQQYNGWRGFVAEVRVAFHVSVFRVLRVVCVSFVRVVVNLRRDGIGPLATHVQHSTVQ